VDDVGALVAELIDAGCAPDVAAAAIARAFVAGVNSTGIPRNPVDAVAEKRRAYDRERKRNSTGIPPESTGIPNSPSIVLEKEEKKEKKERGSQIPDGFQPDEVRWEAACRVFGRDGARQELEKFTAHHKSKGTVFKNWNFGWDKWMLNAKQWAPKSSASSVVRPAEINWRQALETFRDFRRWPRGIGNDPDSPACQAPPELLSEFGFKPILQLRAMP
jgi:hypothetical protein